MSELGEYERLLRAITAPELTAGLMMARYEHAVLARQTWERAVAFAGAVGRRVGVVDFADADDDVDMLVRLTEGGVDVDVVFAVGLERLLVELGAPRERTAAIVRLNFDRDLIDQRVGKPIVLWLSYRAARAFALQAADTFDVIRTTFEFPETLGADLRLTHDVLPHWMVSVPSDDVPHLEQRAQLLASLYADHPPAPQAADLAASLAKVEFALGHRAEAFEWSVRAAHSFEACGDLEESARQYINRSRMHVRFGELDAALADLDRADQLAKQASNIDVQYDAIVARIDILVERGEFDQALALLDSAPVEAYVERSELWRAVVTGRRVAVLKARGDLDAALRIDLDEQLPLAEHLGDDRLHALILMDIADVRLLRGELDEALRLYRDEVLPRVTWPQDARIRGFVLDRMAQVLESRGDLDEANRLRREAGQLADQLGQVDEDPDDQ